MTEQFDARKPPVSRTVRRYDRQGQKINHWQMVTVPLLRDSFFSSVLTACSLSMFMWYSNWYIYGGVDFEYLINAPTARWFIAMGSACAFCAGGFIRGPYYQQLYYTNSKPLPTKETVESIVNTGSPELSPTRTISGKRITFEPKTLKYKDDTFTLNRWQVKWFADQYESGDMAIRKISNDKWFGTQDIPDHPIAKGKYSKFIRICKLLGYVKVIGNENKITHNWIIEVLGLPLPNSPTEEN